MKYYSEVTKKLYDDQKALEDAEQDVALSKADEENRKAKLLAERKDRAAEVEAARKAMLDAQKAYKDEIEGFCKDYGTYHTSWKSTRDIPTLFDFFFDF